MYVATYYPPGSVISPVLAFFEIMGTAWKQKKKIINANSTAATPSPPFLDKKKKTPDRRSPPALNVKWQH
jgi:hypothetical protein